MHIHRTSPAPRGFAAMDAERQREVSSIGGHSAHAGGRAHRFTPEEARIAGRKGGSTVSREREHLAAIGRRGGRSQVKRRANAPEGGTE